ncbi:MAG: class I SAM-dependent methyltransferase [Deltaproteobacteria bacterium]|nr:class I SAM-dependent methyltransferase [Deltaproteobacteria bacterium]
MDGLNKNQIRRVFKDARKHRSIGQLIRRFSTNQGDIREVTLRGIDLTNCRKVLELGCAFGAYTESLKGRLHPDAVIKGIDIIPEYKIFFLEACRRAGYEGTFSSAGVEQIKHDDADAYDLILCSYALYFFPYMIAEIPRILKENGTFIAITHSRHDMQELISLTKKILRQNGLLDERQPLPIEIIVGQFSAQNGRKQLKPCFDHIRAIDFKNRLIFEPSEIDHFFEYFHFKKSFFLMGTEAGQKDIVSQLLEALAEAAMRGRNITMSKDDRIFICTRPIKPKGDRERP